MKAIGDVDARVHIFAVTTLGRGRVVLSYARPSLPKKASVLILLEAEWTTGPVWARRREEKSPPLLTRDRIRAVHSVTKSLG